MLARIRSWLPGDARMATSATRADAGATPERTGHAAPAENEIWRAALIQAIPLAGALRVLTLRLVAPGVRRWTGATE